MDSNRDLFGIEEQFNFITNEMSVPVFCLDFSNFENQREKLALFLNIPTDSFNIT